MEKGQNFRIHLLDDGTNMTCREAECQQYLNGWVTMLDESIGEQAAMARWIRFDSKRGFIECPSEEAPTYLGGQGINVLPGLTCFIFEPGQTCFREHKDREVIFLHQRGLRRGAKFQPTQEAYVHKRPVDFNEHMNESAYAVARSIQRG